MSAAASFLARGWTWDGVRARTHVQLYGVWDRLESALHKAPVAPLDEDLDVLDSEPPHEGLPPGPCYHERLEGVVAPSFDRVALFVWLVWLIWLELRK